jgi:hypothetical protein
MKEFDLSNEIDGDIIARRRILSMVETIHQLNPNIGVQSYSIPGKREYNCIQWDNPADKNTYTEALLLREQLKKTKDLWIILLMEEANAIQQKALSLHTISQEMPLHQKTLYDYKFDAAQDYVGRVQAWQQQEGTQALPSNEQVPVPPIILEEGSRTGDPLYYLCLAILHNFAESQETLKRFYGQVEGERRVTKQRIIACANIPELNNVEWANWPKYVGNPPTPQD